MKLSDFLTDLGQPFPYYPQLAVIIGVKECVLLCRIIWWTGLEKDADGWIYKTRDGIREETGMSHEEQATARKRLKEFGLLKERNDRLNHRVYYRAELTKLDELWDESARRPETGNPGAGHVATTASRSREPRPRLSTEETTEETTKEDTASAAVPSESPKKENASTLIGLWHDNWKETYGEGYVLAGGKDTGAAKRLMAATGMGASELMGIAIIAWDARSDRKRYWHCDASITISGFASKFNEIRNELRKGGRITVVKLISKPGGTLVTTSGQL